jgi:sugar (pentulose or hexulose) kinase
VVWTLDGKTPVLGIGGDNAAAALAAAIDALAS